MEVLEGPTGRRRWTDEKRAEIIAESFEPGAKVQDVARRHGMQPQHLSTWRSQARAGKIMLPADVDLPVFAPIVVEEEDLAAPSPKDEIPAMIEVEAADVVLRAPCTIDPEKLARLVAALRDAK